MPVTQIVIATKNPGKVYEIKQILNNSSIGLISLSELPAIPDIEETGATFEENAILKAEEVYKHFGQPCISDDSGLTVDVLNGEPGIYSARYAHENASDDENITKLLNELRKLPAPYAAKFVCSTVYYDGLKRISASGEMPGQIITHKKGNNGFGYDPVFMPEGTGKTTAQLTDEEKNAISHRGKALRALIQRLRDESIV